MCAFPRPATLPGHASGLRAVQPESEMDSARAHFLMPRARNAKGVLVGGVAVAGAIAIGAVTLATAVITGVRRSRSSRLRGKTVLITALLAGWVSRWLRSSLATAPASYSPHAITKNLIAPEPNCSIRVPSPVRSEERRVGKEG